MLTSVNNLEIIDSKTLQQGVLWDRASISAWQPVCRTGDELGSQLTRQKLN
jgi:hypothetical protein